MPSKDERNERLSDEDLKYYADDKAMLAYDDATVVSMARELLEMRKIWRATWRPIETAPKDRTIIVFAPGHSLKWDPPLWEPPLPDVMSVCVWHPDAGFCIDELRKPTHWMPLPAPPERLRDNPG